jgi:hypothetical protein
MAAPLISSVSTTGVPPTAGNTSGVGNVLQVPTATLVSANGAGSGGVNDLFAQLQEFGWKGVTFPVVETDLEIRQDLVIHKFADRNGAYVEGVGRHPVQVTARIPFLNHIYSAASESWPQGNLYPYQWRFFLKACLEGTSGLLQHPELGLLNCKLDISKTTWKADVRGGVWVHATWIESDDTQADQLGQDLSAESPIAQLTSSADDIDQQIATLQAAVALQQQPIPPLPFTFDALAKAISGSIDQVTIFEKQFQGMTDNLVYQCNRVETSLNLAQNASPTNWPIFQNCERLKSIAAHLQDLPAIGSNGKKILTFATQKDSTLGQLAAQVGADVGEFLVLNGQFAGSPVVPGGSVLRYFSSVS